MESRLVDTLTLQLSDEPVVTLPTGLARRAGLEEGDAIEAAITPEGLTLAPARDYAGAWHALEERLRYQAADLGLTDIDRRDDEYWRIVEPMLQDLERDALA